MAHKIALGLHDLAVWERRARQLAWVSLLWHIAEGMLAIGLGVAAGSAALVAFGADSFIEATAGGVVLWRLTGSRLRAHGQVAERRAARLIAVTFYLLAAYIAVQATYALVTATKADPSPFGIVLAVVTLLAMPPLAVAKRRIGHRIRSCATRSEGTQNMLCAYLSAALLVGLGANAVLGWWWADPVIAVVIGAVAVREGRSSWRGDVGCC